MKYCEGLSANDIAEPRVISAALYNLALVYFVRGDYEPAKGLLIQAVTQGGEGLNNSLFDGDGYRLKQKIMHVHDLIVEIQRRETIHLSSKNIPQ